ncbi:hypothetical protein CMO93_04400 [Candidatus Woesearchaeota archaeon]|jgi:hypothetical protein|nr:hypothetical protein [Candidatus Woesearchaeota archaeon]|tara:strand:+ start:173 stop:493 length:321 start_codon:yes stop_codon:yes gene_type:complete
MSSFEKVKKFLKELKEENIHFKKHFYDKVKERPISEEMIREYIKKTDRLLKVGEQPSKREGEEKYKLWIKLSNKYSLVVIVAISKKDLYIITSWNTDRKWQKSIQK